LDRADVETVLGQPVGPPFDPTTRSPFPPFLVVGMRFCALQTESKAASIQVGVASIFARDVFEQHNERPNSDYKPVGGFGDEAVRAPSGLGTGQRMLVLKGRNVVGIAVLFGRGDVAYVEERSNRATTKILQRLAP